MEFKLEGLFVAIFGILPGFVSTSVRQTIAPTQSASAGEWVARSIVASMVFNFIAAVIFVGCFLPNFLNYKMNGLEVSLKELPGWYVLVYLGIVYCISIVWGLIAGFGADLAPRVLAYRFRLTPISPAPDVFNETLGRLVRTRQNLRLRGQDHMQVPWLRVRRADSVVVGRLTNSSVNVSLDRPIEVFLNPAVILRYGGDVIAHSHVIDGQFKEIYLRIQPTEIVEIYLASAVSGLLEHGLHPASRMDAVAATEMKTPGPKRSG